MKGVVVEQTQFERIDDAVIIENKDKKKKRRPRRSKQSSSVSELIVGAACNSVNEISGDASELLRDGSFSNYVTPDVQQQPRASDVAFNSLPIMHINNDTLVNTAVQESGGSRDQQMHPSDSNGRVFSQSCPEPIACEEPMSSLLNKDFFPSYHGRKYFPSHWPTDTVTASLEKGLLFKALFRVNAHNRLEAYCKIDGVQTDILISGVVTQNRAVEGDTVAIKVDPSLFWTRMKGSAGNSDNSAVTDDCNALSGSPEFVRDSCRDKDMVGADYDHPNYKNCLPLPEQQGIRHENGGYHGESQDMSGLRSQVNMSDNFMTGPSGAGCSIDLNGAVIGVEKLRAMISSFPSKRPTGRVVAIIERSPRRDAIVGFLNIKKWVSSRERYKRDNKKNKQVSSLSSEYLLLTPTDTRFPEMMVPVVSLPDCIKNRLQDGYAAVGMDLVAAKIAEWGEDNNAPLAQVMHVFGRGGEVDTHIAAILFENAILSSEFSSEALLCLPSVPWELPKEEFQTRKDHRNLCVFTIDPATSTDLDDALSVERLSDDTVRVGVHIADVSYFVLPETALDREAQIRSTSVYLLQQKLSMLPSLLSENLGSLNPGVDRLAFSIFWDIDFSGNVLDHWIGRTIIRSCCKLSYENAQDIIDGSLDAESFNTGESSWPQLHGHFEWSDLIKSIKILHEISKILKENRFNSGALSLESPKLVFSFDEDGSPCDSMLCGTTESNSLVEEFMLLANRTAAEVITRAYPSSALLRKHPEPNLRKLKEFEAFCSKHGLKLDTSSSGQLHQSLEHIKQELSDDSVLLDILMSYASRPMQLAAYFCSGDSKDTESNWRHYALAIPLYTHFTSPLRRYPDIVVQRTLAAAVDAEEMYLKHKNLLQKLNDGEMKKRCFTGICFDKDAAESQEAQEALLAAASKHRVPSTEILSDVATYCNERELASRHARDATDKLYMWFLLKKKEILLSEARVLGLGPRFMSIYVHRLAMECRIYYDEVEGLDVEWLDSTSTLVLGLSANKRPHRKGSPGKGRTLEQVALVVKPYDLKTEVVMSGESSDKKIAPHTGDDATKYSFSDMTGNEPAVFPLIVRLLSTISVALHAVGGEDGPLDIGVRLYVSSYLIR